MKKIKRDLESVVTRLKALTEKAEKVSKALEKLQESGGDKKPGRKPVARKKAPAKKPSPQKGTDKKAKKVSASDAVLAIIKRSKKGVDSATLKKKTGIKDNNLRTIIYRLKKRNEIKSESKGIYVKA